jgi:hypothetical protein
MEIYLSGSSFVKLMVAIKYREEWGIRHQIQPEVHMEWEFGSALELVGTHSFHKNSNS